MCFDFSLLVGFGLLGLLIRCIIVSYYGLTVVCLFCYGFGVLCCLRVWCLLMWLILCFWFWFLRVGWDWLPFACF